MAAIYYSCVFRKALALAAVACCGACQARATGSAGLGAVSIGVSEAAVETLAAIGLLWPLWGTVRWRGGWRIAAALPLAAAVLWGLKSAFDIFFGDPASHGLLLLEYAAGAVAVVPYMAVVAIWRRLRTKRPR
jgi:hypothetical protein